MLTSHHTSSRWLAPILNELSFLVFLWVALWVLYVASEPRVRRHWPDALISWARFQSGRFRDPLVASHILAGVVLMELWARLFLPAVAVATSEAPFVGDVESLTSVAHTIADCFFGVVSGLRESMFILVVVVLIRTLVRRVWLADLVASVLLGFTRYDLFGSGLSAQVGAVAVFGSGIYLFLWQLRRFGFLTYLVTSLTFNFIGPVTLGTWYTPRQVVVQMIPIAVLLWALWVIVTVRQRLSPVGVPV